MMMMVMMMLVMLMMLVMAVVTVCHAFTHNTVTRSLGHSVTQSTADHQRDVPGVTSVVDA
jgi:outer membrane protein assembly factor BamE (lipoprotein component of BamABCDE complex)